MSHQTIPASFEANIQEHPFQVQYLQSFLNTFVKKKARCDHLNLMLLSLFQPCSILIT